jgi:hypothetical protein
MTCPCSCKTPLATIAIEKVFEDIGHVNSEGHRTWVSRMCTQKEHGFRVHMAFDLSVYDLGEVGELVYMAAMLPIVSRSFG